MEKPYRKSRLHLWVDAKTMQISRSKLYLSTNECDQQMLFAEKLILKFSFFPPPPNIYLAQQKIISVLKRRSVTIFCDPILEQRGF